MIFGMMKLRKSNLKCIFVCIGLLFIAPANASDVLQAKVFSALSKVKHVEANFIETKTISLLSNSVVFSGTLEFSAPDSLTKRTLKPKNMLSKVTDDRLILEDESGERSEMYLSDHLLIEMFVEAYRGVLSGNIKKLHEYYDVSVTGNINKWDIVLTPLDEDGLEYIESIDIEGKDEAVLRITTVESSGDKTVLDIINKKITKHRE